MPTLSRVTSGDERLYAGNVKNRGFPFLREFPVATLVFMPYAVLILPQAIIFNNEYIGFIVRVMMLAVVPALAVEALTRRRSPRPLRVERVGDLRGLLVLAALVSLIGAVSGILRALAGVGSVFAQVVGASSSSLVVTALSSLTPFATVGIALVAYVYIAGGCSRRTCLVYVAGALAAQAVIAYLNAITASFFAFAIAAALVLLYLGIISLRHCAAMGLLILVLWPTIFVLRNEARRAGGVAVSSRVGAFDRLRYDLQITRAAELGHSLDIPTPGPLEMLRYGLIPRFLDPGRPPLSTGSAINVYLGGTAESSFTFLPVTTTYVVAGPLAVIALYALWALVVRVLLKGGHRVTWVRVAVLALLIDGPLGWFATYPDATVGFLQSVVSLLVIGMLFLLLKWLRRPRRAQKQTLSRL